MFHGSQHFLLTRGVFLLIWLFLVVSLDPAHAINSLVSQNSFDIIDANRDDCITREEHDSFRGVPWKPSEQRPNDSPSVDGSLKRPSQVTFPLNITFEYQMASVVEEAQTPADLIDRRVPSSPGRELAREPPPAAPTVSEGVPDGTPPLNHNGTVAEIDELNAVYAAAQLQEALETDSIETVLLYSNVSIESGSPLPVLERPLAILGRCDGGNLCELDGNYGERHLSVGPGGNLLLRDVALRRGIATQGGAVYLLEGGVATLEDCVLEDNQALEGGAVFLNGSGTNITLSACSLQHNVASSKTGGGGAVYGGFGSATILRAGTRVIQNRAYDGGGLFVHGEGSYLRAESGEISNNLAEDRGGGVFGDGTRMELLEGCTLVGNKASEGGAVLLQSSEGVYQNCTFTQNSATHAGGAIFTTHAQIDMTDTLVSENKAFVEGGGLNIYNGSNLVMARSNISINNAGKHYSWSSVLDASASSTNLADVIEVPGGTR
ncbi:hypothetical protein CYMTET_14739 [Cymbomonas tetramitiformis]|uniref:Right handed beta helix domain-containing protein n=1 Tax=Cymbomonas tetramitiformis TaxID=36881 RepID=A0AAE0GFQ1_9CHLO|nr:hypothetical protein CYMTET_14739 [Cymbomonas tetramitiformis]